MAIKIAGTEVINDNKRVLNNESLPDVRPSLLLDFANSKTLDPRITFTRGSTATYWDGKTTAKAEENLAVYSEDLSQSPWSIQGGAVAQNDTTAPDGETTADKYTEDSSTGFHTVGRGSGDPIASGSTYTISIYLKNNSGTRNVGLRGLGNGGVGEFPIFNIVSGTIVDSGTEWTNVSITDVGSGWYRCAATTTATSTGSAILQLLDGSTQNYTGDGTSSTFFWGCQVEQRSSATAYTATTTSPIVKYQPVLQTAASGEARFDHDPVTGESKGLLIEEARTNLLPYSEAFDNAAWSKTGSTTVMSNQLVAPDGTLTADTIDDRDTSSASLISTFISGASVTNYTASIYVKAGTSTECTFNCYNDADAAGEINFKVNLIDGTISSISGSNYVSSSSEHVGNGWYRISQTFASDTSGGNLLFRLWPNPRDIHPPTGYVHVWGAQLEEGSFPTSYIPTSGSTVTRAQDLSVVNNFDTVAGSSVFGLSGYVQVEHIEGAGSIPVGFVDASNTFNYSTYIISRYISGETLNFLLKNGGVNEATLGVTLTETNKTLTYGFAASREDVAFTANGLTASTSTTATPPQWVKMSIGVSPWGNDNNINGYIKKLAIYPKRLPNATLQAMTEA